MARDLYSPGDLIKAAEDIEAAAKAVRAAVDEMEKVGLPEVLIHADTQLNRNIPSIIDWAEKILAECRAAARAFSSGRPSRAKFDKERNAKAAEKKKAEKKASQRVADSTTRK